MNVPPRFYVSDGGHSVEYLRADLVDNNVRHEREMCARVADAYGLEGHCSPDFTDAAEEIATRIRARLGVEEET